MSPTNEQAFIEWLQHEIDKIDEVMPVQIRNEVSIDLEGYLRCLKNCKEKFISLTNPTNTTTDGK